MNSKGIKNLILSALFLSMGILLPMIFGQIQIIGKTLLPMHIPVFLCALICSWKYGLTVGFFLPIVRSLLFAMPPMYPTAVATALEMATYGIVAGLMYHRLIKRPLLSLYLSLAISMIAGRLIRTLAELLLLNLSGNTFVLSAFFTGTILVGIPGIILQFIIIPAIILLLNKLNFQETHDTHKNIK